MARITHDHDDSGIAKWGLDCVLQHIAVPNSEASIVAVKVDGVTVWKKPQPKKRIHPERDFMHFVQELSLPDGGEWDVYWMFIPGGHPNSQDSCSPRYFPATWER